MHPPKLGEFVFVDSGNPRRKVQEAKVVEVRMTETEVEILLDESSLRCILFKDGKLFIPTSRFHTTHDPDPDGWESSWKPCPYKITKTRPQNRPVITYVEQQQNAQDLASAKDAYRQAHNGRWPTDQQLEKFCGRNFMQDFWV